MNNLFILTYFRGTRALQEFLRFDFNHFLDCLRFRLLSILIRLQGLILEEENASAKQTESQYDRDPNDKKNASLLPLGEQVNLTQH
jgi:hypothetical protein